MHGQPHIIVTSIWQITVTRTKSISTNRNLSIFCNYLTVRSRALPGKLIVPKLVKDFPAFYGNRKFITTFTSTRHMSLSWTTTVQYLPSYSTSWKLILILSFHLCPGIQSGLFHQVSPPNPSMHPSCPPYVSHAPIIFYKVTEIYGCHVSCKIPSPPHKFAKF